MPSVFVGLLILLLKKIRHMYWDSDLPRDYEMLGFRTEQSEAFDDDFRNASAAGLPTRTSSTLYYG